MTAKLPNDIFQFSLLGAFNLGFVDPGPAVSALPAYGTHGLGHLARPTEGELLFLDSQAYQIHPNSNDSEFPTVQAAPKDARLAFVMVTKFVPEYEITVDGELELDSLLDVFSAEGPDAGGWNSFIPFRVRGEFEVVKLEAILQRSSPTSSGSTDNAVLCEVADVKGTMFGFVGPRWVEGMSVSGVRCYFIADSRLDGKCTGGRVSAFRGKGPVEVCWGVTGRYHVGFPRGQSWDELNLESTG